MIENFDLNKDLFFWINSFAGNNIFLDNLFVFFARDLIFVIFLVFAFYFAWKIFEDGVVRVKELFVYGGGVLSAYILVKILKFMFDIERPFSFFGLETLMRDPDVFSSFPSGHAVLAFGLAISVFFYEKKLGSVLLFLAMLVSLGRVLVGVHFPLDIFVGTVLGISLPYFFYVFFAREK